MGNRVDQAQLHGFIGKQAQRPAAVAHRGRGAGQRRQRRALRPVEALGAATAWRFGQGGLPAPLRIALAHLTHRLPAQARRLTGRLLADARGQGQQRLGPAHGPHRPATRAREIFQGGLVSGWQDKGSDWTCQRTLTPTTLFCWLTPLTKH